MHFASADYLEMRIENDHGSEKLLPDVLYALTVFECDCVIIFVRLADT